VVLALQQEAILSLFNKKKGRCAGVVGLTFFSDGLALVYVEHDGDGRAQVKLSHTVDCASDAHAEALTAVVQQYQLQKSPCVAVMARGAYSLIQIDKPDVAENEMRDAVRWQIKDLLDFPAEDAVIELFSAASSASPQAAFAVAAAEKKVRYVVDAMRGAELDVRAIDIPELALRNIVAKTAENERGAALLTLWDGNGLITIVHKGELCMARRINLGIKELIAAADGDGSFAATSSAGDEIAVEISQAQQNILDDMVLEIQRSLDYYESSVAHQAVSALLIAPLTEPVPGLQDYLSSYLAPQVRSLDLGLLVSGDAMSSMSQSRCLSAVGAALRSDIG
jgi:MSHA biogenesis protein MshI